MSTPFAWGRECQHPFDTLINALCNALAQGLPDPEVKYCLHLIASQYALGPVLSQVPDKAEKVEGYFSCKLHNATTPHPAYDTEQLGL
jgi:hypothetical protein